MAPLIVITGPTASGKTGLALQLASRYGGEIICADSRTIYRGMDIGTAKPTVKEQELVPHHGLDLVNPGERYTARDFQAMATETIGSIRSRKKIPFLVGGTGLYIDAVVREYQWPEVVANTATYEDLTIEELHQLIKKQQLTIPVNARNKRHLIGTLARGGVAGQALPAPSENTVVVAIATDKHELERRITERAYQMFESGVIDEARGLAERYGWNSEAMKSNIYPIIRRLVEGELDHAEAVRQFIIRDRQLAKRQVTWLRRNTYVRWLPLEEAGRYIETQLQEMC